MQLNFIIVIVYKSMSLYNFVIMIVFVFVVMSALDVDEIKLSLLFLLSSLSSCYRWTKIHDRHRRSMIVIIVMSSLYCVFAGPRRRCVVVGVSP